MKAHIEAIIALLGTTNYDVYFVDVDEDNPTLPYYVVWCPPGVPFDDSLCGDGDDLWERVNVTSVAGTTLGVLSVQASARSKLNRVAPTVTGRHVEPLKLLPQDVPIDVDRAVTLTSTNRHPAFGVDTYRLSSTAATVASVPAP